MSRKIQMADVVRAHMEVRGCPVLTSNQCYAIAMNLNCQIGAPNPPQPIYDEAKERELFEAFVVNFHHGAKLTGYVHDDPDYPGLNGQFLYEDWDVQSAWAVWQKCAQSRAKAGEMGHE